MTYTAAITTSPDNEIARLFDFYVAEYERHFRLAKIKNVDADIKARRSADLKSLLADMVKDFGVDGMWEIIGIATDRANIILNARPFACVGGELGCVDY